MKYKFEIFFWKNFVVYVDIVFGVLFLKRGFDIYEEFFSIWLVVVIYIRDYFMIKFIFFLSYFYKEIK